MLHQLELMQQDILYFIKKSKIKWLIKLKRRKLERFMEINIM
jgi:hypothetical protein